MPIDIHTAAILLSICNVMQVIALFTQYRVDRNHSGTGWWTLGTAMFSLAFGCSFLKDVPGIGSIVIVANNILFCFGFSLTYVGFRRFVGQPARRASVMALCGSACVAVVWFTYIANSLAARRVIVSSVIVLMCLAMVRTLLVNDLGRVALASRYFLCAVFLTEVGLMIVNAALSYAGRTAFSQSLAIILIYLGSMVTSTLWAFGVILLVSQRLLAEREQNISELNAAIEQIKTLRGILPICSGCKKIRDDQGYWEQVDSYISRHSEAEFTHGMCPECLNSLYGDFRSARKRG